MTTTSEDKAPREFEDTAKAVRKGLIMIYTGDGKGKTTASLGMVFRALGRNYRVAVVQFIKGAWKTGEALFAKELEGRVDFFSLGDGFTWITQNFEQDVKSAREAWDKCLEVIVDPQYRIVIFDELNYVIKYNFLTVGEVLDGLKRKPADTHVVITGRDAPPELIEVADLVTEMRDIKHPYRAGIKAQPGVDY